MALQTAPIPSQSTEPAERQAPFYRFYLLQADDHIARRREDYFADDATAMAAAKSFIGDYPRVEIWCGPRKVVTLSREAAALLQPPRKTPRAGLLISRNHRMLQQAATVCRRTEALCARPTARQRGGGWATSTYPSRGSRDLP